MRTRTIRLAAILLGLVAVLAACGGGDDTSSDGTAAGGDTAATDGDTGAAADDEQVSELIVEGDLAPVCRGTGIEAAAAYTPDDGPNLVVVLGGEPPEYSPLSVELPDGWEPEFEQLGDTELVACLDLIEATPTQLCEGYEDEGLEWAVQLHDSTWEVAVRSATTAEILASGTYDAPAEDCPVVSFYSEGDPSPKAEYDVPDAEIELLLAELVTGSAPAAGASTDTDAATEPDTETTEAPSDSEAPEGGDAAGEPQDYGDDSALDALWDSCEAGDGEACDDLFFQSPIGSRYEDFGNTCGDRFPDGNQLCSLEELG